MEKQETPEQKAKRLGVPVVKPLSKKIKDAIFEREAEQTEKKKTSDDLRSSVISEMNKAMSVCGECGKENKGGFTKIACDNPCCPCGNYVHVTM